MAIYYHETVDVSPVREKEVEYLRTIGEVSKIINTPASEFHCVANWIVVYCFGRWPQVIGLWEIESWEWFVNHFTRYSLEVDHPEGYERFRSGGFDRFLIPHGDTPTLARITEEGLRAPYVLQETITLQPGTALEYLAALSEAGAKVTASDAAVRLHGAFNVMLRNDSEVLVQWVYDDLQTFASTLERSDAVPELTAWRRQAAPLERTHTGVLLKPTAWSPLS